MTHPSRGAVVTATTERIDEFVGAAATSFERAWAHGATNGRSREWSLALAGRSIRLRVAGSTIAARFLPALEHAVVSHDCFGAPDLTVSCWDRAEVGEPPPPPPWSFDDMLPRGRVRGQTRDRVRVTYDTWMRMLCIYDRERAEALVHVADASEVPHWVDRSPFRSVLTWWAGDRALGFLHASAVALDGGGVAIAGASGSGKSTTALACFAAGFDFIGDDACIASLDDDGAVFPVYGLAKLEADALHLLPALRSRARPAAGDASQLVLDPSRRLRACASLRALLLPQIRDRDRAELVRLSGHEALRVLVPSSLLEGAGAGGSSLNALTRLVESTPCFRLELGRDLESVVSCVRRACEG